MSIGTKTKRPVDYVASQEGSALGARLRRLSDRIDREADAFYRTLDVDFQQRWFGVFNQIALHESRTVGEIAAALGVTHVAVSQVRTALAERGLIVAEVDPEDARRRTLRLSASGKRLASKLAPVWRAFSATGRELDAEAGGAARALMRLEQALDQTSLAARVTAKL